MDNNKEELARAEVDVEHLEREIGEVRTNLGREKTAMASLRDGLAKGDLRLAGHVSYTAEEVKSELAHRLDHYRNVSKILEEKETTLKARQRSVLSARQKLTEMAAQKRTLATKLESIQARLQAIEATQEKNEFNFDDSALARAKSTVSDLERRLEVKTRVAEMEGSYADGLPISVESGRDVVNEFDEEFGKPAKDSGDKSL
jgi:chromosome segregation ATPase